MAPRRLSASLLLVAACLAGGPSAATNLSVTELLDRYAAGRFDAVVEELSGDVNFDDLLKQLRREGPAWIAAATPEKRAVRELAAATFALEAARVHEWDEWKLIQRQPAMCASPIRPQAVEQRSEECYQPLNVLYWKAPPLLIEWGCERFRRDTVPRPIERWWQLAALAVAQRSEDPQFLVGDPNIGKGVGAGEIGNRSDEITHLEHVTPRFPREMRFLLAQGIARDRVWADDAVMAYGALEKDPDVGGEATMRLGELRMRQRRLPDALKSFESAETLTRDPYVVFLARYFTAKVYERQKQTGNAEAAYRGAVAAIPHAQSGTIALAALVFRDGRRAESYHLVRDMLAADPVPLDPWRAYVHADDRFWPRLIGRLRAEILK